MKTTWIASTALVLGLLGAGAALAQSSPFEEFHVVPGRCVELTMNGTSLTGKCNGKLVFSTMTNGRIQSTFALASGSMMAFAGTDLPNPTANSDAYAVDAIYLNGQPVQARGRCTYTNPYAGPFIVACKVTGAGGVPYVAKFRADHFRP